MAAPTGRPVQRATWRSFSGRINAGRTVVYGCRGVLGQTTSVGTEDPNSTPSENTRQRHPRILTSAALASSEASFRPSSQDLASLLEVSEAVEPGDVMVIDRSGSGLMRRADGASDTGVVGVVTASPGVVLGMASPSRLVAEPPVDHAAGEAADLEVVLAGDSVLRAPVAFSGVVRCKVDAGFGAIWPGDLLVTSPTPGHAMRADAPLPGTMLGKALEPLEEGVGTIRVLVMLR